MSQLYKATEEGTLQLDPAAAGNYIKTNTGLASTLIRNNKIMSQIANPDRALRDYEAAVNELMNKAGASFVGDMQMLSEAGFSEEDAKKVALKKQTSVIQAELDLLKLKHPLAGDISTMASAQAGFQLKI